MCPFIISLHFLQSVLAPALGTSTISTAIRTSIISTATTPHNNLQARTAYVKPDVHCLSATSTNALASTSSTSTLAPGLVDMKQDMLSLVKLRSAALTNCTTITVGTTNTTCQC